jgi:hypothetical protein
MGYEAMNPLTRYRALGALLSVTALASCEKNAVQVLPNGPLENSRVKFFNLGVGAPGVNFYANTTKMTAISSGTQTEATTGTTYGNAGNAGLYAAIAAGQYTLTGRIAATTDKNLPIDTLSATIADGKYYSFYLSGPYSTTTKKVDAFIVEDPVPTQDFSTAYVRLVHAISNANPLTLYGRPTGDTVTAHWTALGSAVAYKGADEFAAIAPGVYDLGARFTDSTTNRTTLTGVSLVRGQSYTINARGNNTATTGATRDSLSSSTNY